MTTEIDSISDSYQQGFRIADLADRSFCRGPTVFRFLNRRTIATTNRGHPAFVDASDAFLREEATAFETHGIRFAGTPPNNTQLKTFARALTCSRNASTPRSIIGRYWTDIEIAEVGKFDGLSFWLSHQDLEQASWARAAAIEILGLRNSVYVESIDQCAPEIFKGKSENSQLKSKIDPSLTAVEILNLLTKSLASDPALSRKQWEIVSEFRGSAYDLANLAAGAQGLPIEMRWRWQPGFNRMVARHRAAFLKALQQ